VPGGAITYNMYRLINNPGFSKSAPDLFFRFGLENRKQKTGPNKSRALKRNKKGISHGNYN
jgi:hypothetical protein